MSSQNSGHGLSLADLFVLVHVAFGVTLVTSAFVAQPEGADHILNSLGGLMISIDIAVALFLLRSYFKDPKVFGQFLGGVIVTHSTWPAAAAIGSWLVLHGLLWFFGLVLPENAEVLARLGTGVAMSAVLLFGAFQIRKVRKMLVEEAVEPDIEFEEGMSKGWRASAFRKVVASVSWDALYSGFVKVVLILKQSFWGAMAVFGEVGLQVGGWTLLVFVLTIIAGRNVARKERWARTMSYRGVAAIIFLFSFFEWVSYVCIVDALTFVQLGIELEWHGIDLRKVAAALLMLYPAWREWTKIRGDVATAANSKATQSIAAA